MSDAWQGRVHVTYALPNGLQLDAGLVGAVPGVREQVRIVALGETWKCWVLDVIWTVEFNSEHDVRHRARVVLANEP